MSRKKSDYFDQMHKPTEQYVDAQLRERYKIFKQKSEFKKPYLEDGFPEMEYQGFDWPNIKPYYPDYPPIEPIDVETPGGGIIPWYITGCSLTCTPSVIRDCDRTYCCTLNPAWQPIASIEIEGPGTLTQQSESGSGMGTGSQICFTVNSTAQQGDHIIIKVTTKPRAGQEKGSTCEGSFVVGIDCTECDCATTTDVAYDTTNSDETIDRDGTATIIVTDGCGPFSWSVAGTGFSIPGTSQGRTNTLSADNTACGSAIITVTDKCGDTCTGYVRGTTGQWVIKQTANMSACGLPGVGTHTDCGTNCDSFELIEGNKKQTQAVFSLGGCGLNDDESCCGCTNCCNDGGSDCSGWRCLPCIDYHNGNYLVPHYVAPEGDHSHKAKNTELYYSEWEC